MLLAGAGSSTQVPETCALIVFVLSVVQLVFLGSIEVGHIVASLCALYSAVLYGREHAWRWTGSAAVTCSVLMGLKIAADQHGYITLFGAITASVGLTKPVSAASSSTAAFFTGVMYTIAVLILCAGIMAWARWTRSSDSNALVLQARGSAGGRAGEAAYSRGEYGTRPYQCQHSG